MIGCNAQRCRPAASVGRNAGPSRSEPGGGPDAGVWATGSGWSRNSRSIVDGAKRLSGAVWRRRRISGYCARDRSLDMAQQRSDAVDEGFAADKADVGMGFGLPGQMLTGAEADFQPVSLPGRIEERRQIDQCRLPAFGPAVAAAGFRPAGTGPCATGGRGGGRGTADTQRRRAPPGSCRSPSPP